MRHLLSALVSSIALLSTASLAAETQTFSYTGAEQSFVVPAGVTSVSIRAHGASGFSGNFPGGLGGLAEGVLAVTPGETLFIYVGGQGTASTGNMVPEGGGFNGGGDGQNNGGTNEVGGGGGASDVRQGGNGLAQRVLVAGGGGGATNNSSLPGGDAFGGDGGGLVGEDGGDCYDYVGGTGGTQDAGGVPGGALGQGGNADGTMTPWNGGGGGGYYGGGVAPEHCGGGGGSSYLGGVTDGNTVAGQRSGDGLVEITFTAPCESVPATGCNTGGKSSVSFKRGSVAAKNKFQWKLQKATNAIDKATELGDPVAGETRYSVCVYDHSSGVASLVSTMTVEPGGSCGTKPCWKETSKGAGLRFKSKEGNDSGIRAVSAKSGPAGKGSLLVQAGGESFPMPAAISANELFDQDAQLLVQMNALDSGACWESAFGTDSTRKNEPDAFKAVAP